jgi:DNA-binding transcriptional ArsR family regulator
MSYEPVWAVSSWTDWLPAVPNWARENVPTAVIMAALIGIGGTIHFLHVLLAPTSHLQASVQSVWIVLWSLTTFVALGGLITLGWAYTSLLSDLNTGQQVDIEILPEDERRILEPILETPGITQLEVVARSDFSDAKVSQTLKALRERGLVYRESQGRTYRLYLGTVLSDSSL